MTAIRARWRRSASNTRSPANASARSRPRPCANCATRPAGANSRASSNLQRSPSALDSVMNIVVLDGFTLNPGDLSWEELKTLGHCTIYDRTPPDALAERAAGAEILLTNKTELSSAAIGNLPTLKYIGVLATGTNVVDLAAARARGIPVTNVPAYGTRSEERRVGKECRSRWSP